MSSLNWRTKVLIVGGVVGALFGVATAYIYVRSFEKRGEPPELAASDAVGIGLTALGLLRQVASLTEEDKSKKKAR